MKEQEIIQVCKRLKTLKPLLQALRFGAIKFHPLPRTPVTFFAMSSVQGVITFEHDIYYYTTVEGIQFETDVFVNDTPDVKTRILHELQRINDGLRGIKQWN